MDCHFLLQGIFLTQGSNPHLLYWQVDSLLLHHLGSPKFWIRLVKYMIKINLTGFFYYFKVWILEHLKWRVRLLLHFCGQHWSRSWGDPVRDQCPVLLDLRRILRKCNNKEQATGHWGRVWEDIWVVWSWRREEGSSRRQQRPMNNARITEPSLPSVPDIFQKHRRTSSHPPTQWLQKAPSSPSWTMGSWPVSCA